MCDGLILTCCPRNPHGKAGEEERERTLTVELIDASRILCMCIDITL